MALLFGFRVFVMIVFKTCCWVYGGDCAGWFLGLVVSFLTAAFLGGFLGNMEFCQLVVLGGILAGLIRWFYGLMLFGLLLGSGWFDAGCWVWDLARVVCLVRVFGGSLGLVLIAEFVLLGLVTFLLVVLS